MSYDACALLIKAGDPDRHLSAMAAPPEDRGALMAIYALNLEIARAPWASPEPLVAQIRLQWWADEIDKIYRGERVNSHEILPALREVIFDHNLPQPLFIALIEARQLDIYADPPESMAAFDAYIEATSGSVMELAGRALGAPEAALPILRDFAYGAGVANLLRAAPALAARGFSPLPLEVEKVVFAARRRLALARQQRAAIPKRLIPALRAGWRADAALKEAQKRPESIANGLLEESPAWRRLSFQLRLWSGRW